MMYGFAKRHSCCFIEDNVISLHRNILFWDEMALHDMPRAHGSQYGPQAIIQRKDVGHASAGRNRQDRFSSQRKLRQNIQHAFQETGICGLEYRRSENDSARLLHSSERFGDLGLLDISPQQCFRRKISYRKEPGFKIFGSQQTQYMLGYQRCARFR